MSRTLPSLKALRAFEAAGRHLSPSQAAEELHVTLQRREPVRAPPPERYQFRVRAKAAFSPSPVPRFRNAAASRARSLDRGRSGAPGCLTVGASSTLRDAGSAAIACTSFVLVTDEEQGTQALASLLGGDVE